VLSESILHAATTMPPKAVANTTCPPVQDMGTNAALPKPHPVPPIRDWWERAIQTVSFEIGGLLIVGPLWTLVTGASATDSMFLLVCLSAAVMSWMAVYNTVFDLVELRTMGTVASARSHRWRVLHTVGLEVSSALLTCPLIMLIADFGLFEALAADVGLTLAYVIYGYFFHLGFDKLRPVQPCSTRGTGKDLSVSG
jgi:uncharacterized membrane protein